MNGAGLNLVTVGRRRGVSIHVVNNAAAAATSTCLLDGQLHRLLDGQLHRLDGTTPIGFGGRNVVRVGGRTVSSEFNEK